MFLLKCEAHETIWGGQKLVPYTDGTHDVIGHLYSVHCTAEGSNTILTGPDKGKSMNQYFVEHREQFGLQGYDYFPVVIALVDASDNLSIQVHPDDESVLVLDPEMKRGKNESWFFIDTPEEGSIFCGCECKTMDELRNAIKKGEMEQATHRLPVKQGDYVYVRAGTLHAMSKGSLVYEIEENGGATYRFYDFNRKDAEGNTRPLHIPEAFFSVKVGLESTPRQYGSEPIEELRYFTQHLNNISSYRNRSNTLQVFTVLKGTFEFEGNSVTTGSSIILEPRDELVVDVEEAIVAEPKPL
ncbi:MAG: hypothetical protein IJ225_02305 [Solobacterium sp.]|nr:hypothetical protein [Solobacterium sp.]